MKREKWIELEQYPGYEVSNLGKVRSVSRTKLVNGVIRRYVSRVLRTNVCSRGFVNVTLSIDGVRVSRRLHRLVADAYLKDKAGKRHIHHKDNNRSNNCASNLIRVSHVGSDYYNV